MSPPRALVALLLPATVVMLACGDTAPTSSAAAAARAPSPEYASAPPTGGVTVQVLSRSSFPDEIDATFRIKLDGATRVIHVTDPSDVVVAKVTLTPGGSLGWHTHPGPAIVSVASGDLTIINASDCVTRHYVGGKSFVDPGQGNVHIGFNASDVETVAYVTFLDVPAGQGPTIAAADPGCEG